jgi:4-hydroxy-tetrahydrodipicolinate reductase
MEKINIAIHGAAGRMGQRLIAIGNLDKGVNLVAALDAPNHPRLGQDAGEVAGVGKLNLPLKSGLEPGAQVVIDFSVPSGAMTILSQCVAHKTPLVIATTGFEDAQKQTIRDTAKTLPILWAPSMSLAVNLAMKLTEIAGKALKDHPGGADVEIIERHHRFKEDSPSGTALKFGEIVKQSMGISGEVHGREGRPGARPHNEIGYHAVRVGDNPGEHTIVFGLLGETLEINVKASNRDCYAVGAYAAAKFLAHQKPGLYNMGDVLQIK